MGRVSAGRVVSPQEPFIAAEAVGLAWSGCTGWLLVPRSRHDALDEQHAVELVPVPHVYACRLQYRAQRSDHHPPSPGMQACWAPGDEESVPVLKGRFHAVATYGDHEEHSPGPSNGGDAYAEQDHHGTQGAQHRHQRGRSGGKAGLLVLMNGTASTVTVVTVTVLLGLVFTVSGASKLRDLRVFAGALHTLELVKPGLARPLALLVGVAELAVPVLLIIARSVGLVLAVAMLAALTVVVLRTIRRGVTAPCGCFGRTARPITGVQLWRNLVLLLTAIVALAVGPSVVDADLPVVLSAAGLGVLLALATLNLDEWLELLQPPASSSQ